MTFDLIRVVLGIMGQPVSDVTLGNYPTVELCRSAIRQMPLSEKPKGTWHDCRPVLRSRYGA